MVFLILMEEAGRKVMKHIAILNGKPVKSGKSSVPDGGINGNGCLGIITGCTENGLRLYISKCDLREGAEGKNAGGAKPFGWLDIYIPDFGAYSMVTEQDMDNGELRILFTNKENTAALTARVCKTQNAVMLESPTPGIKPVLRPFEEAKTGKTGSFEKDGCTVAYRSFTGEEYIYDTSVFAAEKQIGQGRWYIPVLSSHDTPLPEREVLARASDMTEEKSALLQYPTKSSHTTPEPALTMTYSSVSSRTSIPDIAECRTVP